MSRNGEVVMEQDLADPLFSFLASDAKYQAVRSTLTSRQNEIRAALAQIAM